MRPKFLDKNEKDLTGYHVAAKLNGGTIHETLSVDKQSSDYGYAPVRPRLSYSDVTFLADEMLEKNVVQTGKGTFAAQDTSSYREYISYYNKSGRWSEGFVFEIKAVNDQPTKILPNAWGMKSVTLDGNPIDYFKDWKGTVENLNNDEAHTLKFEWKPLAQELKDAGYSYNATCDRYISGSATPTPDAISPTATEYSYTIPAGAAPKVYSFALHLNLKKGTGNIGIYSNEHIVKLVVNDAPVVEPDPTIEGSVYYTSSIVYDRPISIAASVTPADATKAYRWQRSTDGGGTWYVVVYDDSTVANALRLESVYAYEDITLSENDEAELPTNLPKLLPENSGYHLEWRIVKVGTSGASYLTSDDNITLENGKIKPKAAHTGSANTRLELVAVKEGETNVKSFSQTSRFNVTVTAAPVIELTGLTVAPAKVNLDINDTYQLSAVKEPVNAAGSLTWTSDKPAVAEVDTTGKVTAKAQGTAIITATCGTKSATCTVTVGHTHDTNGQDWVYMDPGTHIKTCAQRATISRWNPTTSPHGRRLMIPIIAVPAPSARSPAKPQTTPKPPTTTGSG